MKFAMPDFHIKRLPYHLTSHASLSLTGQYLKRFAQINQNRRSAISHERDRWHSQAASKLMRAYHAPVSPISTPSNRCAGMTFFSVPGTLYLSLQHRAEQPCDEL
ncbi:hypothetical protein ACFOFO_05200 [Undibacterium arcticum]|uniref:Uncharacterized protein n=1 Tax=Undibacterium arcticum TaxID=1762892 RepID=A0ABV7EXI0_9BURK